MISLRSAALGLFEALVKKNKLPSIEPAIQAAQQGIRDNNYPRVKNAALNLFTALVEKDETYETTVYEAAINAAEEGITSKGGSEAKSALDLFAALVKKNMAIEPALQAAQQGIKSQYGNPKRAALELFKQLIIKIPNKTKPIIQDILTGHYPDLTNDEKNNLRELLNQ